MDNNAHKKGIAGYWLVTMFVAISFAIVFITAGILYFLEAPASLVSFERTAKNWEDRVVKVQAGSELSTGFIMESEKINGDNYVYVITSYHGVDTAIDSVSITVDGEVYSAENLSWNELIDMAVFKFKCDARYSLVGGFNENVGVEVMALGYASGKNYCAEEGIVNSLNYLDVSKGLSPLLCYDVSAYVRQGMSGCPILTIDGDLVGMGVRTKVDNIDGEEIHFSSDNYVVPYSVLLAEYDRAKNHKTAKAAQYTLSEDNASVEIAFDNYTVVYDGTKLSLNGEKIVKVAGKSVSGAVDFIAKISLYSNRNADGEVVVVTSGGSYNVKVA